MSASYSKYITLPDTWKELPTGVGMNAIDKDKVISVILFLKRKKSVDDALQKGLRITREEFEAKYNVTKKNISAVTDFAKHFGLDFAEADHIAGSIILKGSVADLEKAFRISLMEYRNANGSVFHARSGYISVPQELTNIVTGIFGLDNRPDIAYPSSYNSYITPAHKSIRGYSPAEVAEAYGFPKDATGKGECIAVIELGGGYLQKDIEEYFSVLGLPSPHISWVGIDDAYNAPTKPDSYDREVTMNVELVGSIAPDAEIVVYFAPNTDAGFLKAIGTAIYDKTNRASVISVSWGSPEHKWTIQSLNIYNELFKVAALLGITICTATGNYGAFGSIKKDNMLVDFPSSSPYVLSCGGTRLLIKDKIIVSESAWYESHTEGGGGGISEHFPLPDYQEGANIPVSKNKSAFRGRGVPDVAGNADPATGYKILLHGKWVVIGGTSAVAPLYAGLIARINQQAGTSAGFINPVLYRNPDMCRNIPGAFHTRFQPAYKPSNGWDACTGLGVLCKFELPGNTKIPSKNGVKKGLNTVDTL